MIRITGLVFFGLTFMLLPQLGLANEKAKVFQSINGSFNARLVVVPYKDNTYLLQFKGFEHKFDNKTFLYRKIFKAQGSGRGSRYRMADVNTFNFTSLGKTTLINGSSREYSEVHLTGKNSVKMIFTKNADLAIVRRVKAQYLQTQGILESRIAAKKKIKKALDDFHKNCHSKFKVKIDWKIFESAQQKTAPGMTYAYLTSFSRVCTLDKDYRAAVKKFHILELRLSTKAGKDQIGKKGDKIIIYTNQQVPNVLEASYSKIKDLL